MDNTSEGTAPTSVDVRRLSQELSELRRKFSELGLGSESPVILVDRPGSLQRPVSPVSLNAPNIYQDKDRFKILDCLKDYPLLSEIEDEIRIDNWFVGLEIRIRKLGRSIDIIPHLLPSLVTKKLLEEVDREAAKENQSYEEMRDRLIKKWVPQSNRAFHTLSRELDEPKIQSKTLSDAVNEVETLEFKMRRIQNRRKMSTNIGDEDLKRGLYRRLKGDLKLFMRNMLHTEGI